MKKDSTHTSTGCCGTGPNLSRRRFLVVGAGLSTIAMTGCLPIFDGREDSESYANEIMAHDKLRAYWRFDNNLKDIISGNVAVNTGDHAFVDGAVKGSGIKLEPGKALSEANTENLYGRFATIELFFKVDVKPTTGEDSVIIAQADGESVRYIIGIKDDLSALLYRNMNGDVITRIDLPTDKAIEVGRWYHLAVTSFDLDVRAYVDGYECSLFGGAYEFTRRGPETSTMTFGSTSASGWAESNISVDEVATYEDGLTQSDFQRHLSAAGWQDKLAENGALVAAVKSKRDLARQIKTEKILNDPTLTAPGDSRIYRDQYLQAISFTAGGIGAGGIQFNGKAQPKIWQIACNHVEKQLDDTFLALRVKAEGKAAVVKALQTEAVGDFPAMDSLSFKGEYPFANYQFEDKQLPVDVSLEVFNPFTPMDLKNSALPCVIYNVTITNSSPTSIEANVLSSQKNALGYSEGEVSDFGHNVNAIKTEADGTKIIHMTRDKNSKADMFLMSSAQGITATAQWESIAQLKQQFAATGQVQDKLLSEISAQGKSVNGALAAPIQLASGESQTISFILGWYFTETDHGEVKKWTEDNPWKKEGQMYNNWWPNALGLATYLQQNLVDLTERSRRFHKTLYASTLPVWLLDRCSSQLAVLRSQTCWWAKDGYFGAWEGCNPNEGCCAANCTHVWHYAQAHARLLPELARKMREQDYDHMLPSGLIPYRHSNQKPAADGHYGSILNTYREHLCSVDNQWLTGQWPRIKKAMQWGIETWDPKRNGFMTNEQHNTLDGNLDGCSSWIGSLYLSALEATARMADEMGDTELAAEYRQIRRSGKKLQNDRLWNGEYFIQEPGKVRVQDYLDGCHIDQILGEWWADQINIDRNYPAERCKQAMASLLKYNFKADFYGQSLKPRQYCEIDDGGMKMITWPNDPQPIPGMKYGDEVMTGFEYGAAVTMMQNGMLKEGLMLLKVVAERYDGRLRTEGVSSVKNGPWGYSGNPFGDDECGKFYGRSLSVWSSLTTLQGFKYDGPAGTIGFNPLLTPEQHASFFTVAHGYGLYSQKVNGNKLSASVSLTEGEVLLNQIELAVTHNPSTIQVYVKGQPVKFNAKFTRGELQLVFNETVKLNANEMIDIHVNS
jgi:non-lysosomal glucosylceramidase